jgi:penicillin-binding protein 2
MRAVVTSGTARLLSRPGLVPIAGKTGTVQTRSGHRGRNHAWFAGYAPYGSGDSRDPLVVVVFLEYGMGGAAAAAPVAGEVFQAAYPDWKPGDEEVRQPVSPPSYPAPSIIEHSHDSGESHAEDSDMMEESPAEVQE